MFDKPLCVLYKHSFICSVFLGQTLTQDIHASFYYLSYFVVKFCAGLPLPLPKFFEMINIADCKIQVYFFYLMPLRRWIWKQNTVLCPPVTSSQSSERFSASNTEIFANTSGLIYKLMKFFAFLTSTSKNHCMNYLIIWKSRLFASYQHQKQKVIY
jgi:hypothetical protein